MPVIRGNNISDTKLFTGEFVYITDDKADELRSSNVFPGDLVFPHRGAIGQVGIVIDDGTPRYVLSTSLMKLSCDRQKVDPLFIFYFFRSPAGRHELLKNASTVGTPGIGQPLTSLKSVQIPIPELKEQQTITRILGALDDKIELNRRMNETLEGMARAIFKSWFVDFDPVRAKLDNRPPKALDQPTAALFPDSFEHIDGEPIPSGWVKSSIKEKADSIQYGYTTKASDDAEGPRFLRITDIRGGRIAWETVPYCVADNAVLEKYPIEEGDIFVARTGASTGENIYVVDPPDAVFASYLVRFKFKHSGVARFVGEYMRTPDYFAYVAGCIGGSAQPNASAQALAGAPLIFPPEDVCQRFYELVKPLDDMRAKNAKESSTLAALRDTLLPKLLSGEIRLNSLS